MRALRRRELFRIACADLLGNAPFSSFAAGLALDAVAVGQALSDVTDATLAAALRAAESRVNVRGMPFAIIGMGRLGGAELSYSSDADVLFVYEPLPGIAEDAASATAHQIAEELRRLLAAPSPEPPLGVDADLRPEGRQGPLVRSLAAYERYYATWSHTWETQALLRARFVCGSASLGERFIALADRVRYPREGSRRSRSPRSGGSRPGSTPSACPAGPIRPRTPSSAAGDWPTSSGRCNCYNCGTGTRLPALRTPRTLDALTAARDAGTSVQNGRRLPGPGVGDGPQVRNALMLVRGVPATSCPGRAPNSRGSPGPSAARPRAEPGEFLDEYLRTARRARAAAERVFLAP